MFRNDSTKPNESQTQIRSCFLIPVNRWDYLDEILTATTASIGMLGTLFCIVIIHRISATNRSISYRYLLVIFCFNFIYSIFIFSIGFIRNRTYYTDPEVQKIFIYYDVFVFYPFNAISIKVSLLTMTVMAVDRYVLVVHPIWHRRYHSTLVSKFRFIILTIVCYASLFTVYRFLEFYVQYNPAILCYEKKKSSFTQSLFFQNVIGYFNSVFLLILPTILMWSCTVLLANRMCQMSRKISQSRSISAHMLTANSFHKSSCMSRSSTLTRDLSTSPTSPAPSIITGPPSSNSGSANLNRLNVYMSLLVNLFTIPEWLMMIHIDKHISQRYGPDAGRTAFVFINVAETLLPLAMVLALVCFDRNFQRICSQLYRGRFPVRAASTMSETGR